MSQPQLPQLEGVDRKLPQCAGCGERSEDLIEVTEDHESLTFFPGDRVCQECATSHGVL